MDEEISADYMCYSAAKEIMWLWSRQLFPNL